VKRFSEAEKQTIWDMREAGVPVKRIARCLGRQNVSLRKFIATTGGKRPTARERSELRLSLAEREEISRGLAAGRSIRSIAEGLGRAPSTVCREVNANGGRTKYRALVAGRAASRGLCDPSGPSSPNTGGSEAAVRNWRIWEACSRTCRGMRPTITPYSMPW
jgi:IS30 family transposase